ncbi:UDP-glucose dehydrogenase [Acetivibrio thermocellus AD2]|jgi:UDPglucose 6-dehydrogenase|uniref:UDP-glucose 6-dehydrogenase n=1 Tax=Acetivibrio thermocellus AD2 TaxID=1138384 RepID=A0AB36TEE7_ACETH|nr:UDP-glucose/GDP-mannose dehydrogenase family protein [Acetivibrio thermocellus]ADU73969.1 nucleotide sugar dehydrogenase [Acetivibrio thermocellus DSM 1313]ALX07907.1 nucleotide sugar dehydrogenase [Acetivibrio thermocellus AD2]ANV75653.1 nucleotide sugar dehydrogenase [Acetivibrio thermocellus DSM 2360]EIC06105.1 nucleotide sugar dehydrogenase [Acetivibrio thermocellus YS]PFH02178.1 UDP-glucose dehydrogenase [Acetivibrio thermocellus AD2]
MIPKVAMFGTGYVGLVSEVCIADFGINVICVDVDKEKIDGLNNGKIPIYEPGLDVFLERNIKAGRIQFTTDAKMAIEESNVLFIAVGTPPKENGEADMQYVYAVAETIGQYMNGYKVIVDKSTVPVGTGQVVKKIIADKLKERGVEYSFDVVSNPEFLREGKALYDFTHPDRVVIGVESEEVAEIMKKVYRPLYINETPFIITNIETAEMIKYASNAFLATKITFINEIANLCEKVGANVQQVAMAMGRDGRIGPKFLHAGPGFGGSCFPKDTKALVQIAEKHGVQMSVVNAVIEANERQKKMVAEKLEKFAGDLKGKTIGILGLAFKPETDDVREAPALTIIADLIERGASIRAYDPQAMEEAKKALRKYADNITYCKHAYDTAESVDALVIVTEWHEFRNMDLTLLKKIMRGNIFYDARNIYSRKDIEEKGFVFIGTGV